MILPLWAAAKAPVEADSVHISRPKGQTMLAVKSNLAYDAFSFLNYAVELPIYSNKVSLQWQHVFPWWRWGQERNKYCVRYLQMGGEARWWFKPMPRDNRDKLTGHYLGAYFMGGKWDFQRRRSICHQGEFTSAGLSYGFSMPVGRWLNLEFSLSAGYARIPYRKYVPAEDYSQLYKTGSGTWHYFGPTKVEVSLVLPIRINCPVR